MKSLNQMDLDEWELLPDDDGYLEINDDGANNKIYSRKSSSPTTTVFHMNYFICPPKTNTGLPPLANRLLPVVPIDLEPPELEKIKSFPPPDPVSQVFFKKMKENEFVDMKVESPKSSSTKGMMPQLDFQFDQEKEGDHIPCHHNSKDQSDDDHLELLTEKNDNTELDHDEGDQPLNIWKWSLTGIGAICSFGVVAATFCIISFTNQRHKNPHNNQKLQFQIFTDDKRMKQVVHHASKLNEAISSAVRGVPITRAHITFGGYYDASSLL